MRVLLSIKPEFANKIFDGTKKFEFRKVIFRDSNVKQIIVYVSSPVQKVIGEFEIDKILMEEPNDLWHKTKDESGISKDYFFNYFINRSVGYAIGIKNVKKYKIPKCIKTDFKAFPPQSFIYVD
jgi:predicted transcriptional regulator